GRARVLLEMLRGETVPDGWRSAEVRDVLDLCLSCKGCRSDCPVNVDMATYKAEFLHHHYQGRLRPAADYSMGWLPGWARLGALGPGVGKGAVRGGWVAGPAKRLAGMAAERSLPACAAVPFPGGARRGVGNPAGTGIPAGAGDVPYAGGPAGTDVGDLAGTGDLASGGIPAGTGHVPGPGGLAGGGVAGVRRRAHRG